MRSRYSLPTLARQAGIKRKSLALRPIKPTLASETAYRQVLYALLREAAQIVKRDVLPIAGEAKQELTQDTAADRVQQVLGLFRDALARLTGAAEDLRSDE